MALTVPTVEQLSDFSGRPLSSFAPFAVQALLQGTLYMSIVTELTEPPTDPMLAQLMVNGILDFSLVTYLEQPYQGVKASPFQSQNVGGTSYSKPVLYVRGNAQANALKGESTGIMWFDLAVQTLALRTQRGGIFGSSTSVFDGCTYDGLYIKSWQSEDGNSQFSQILGPADIDKQSQTFFDFSFDDWPADEGNMETG